jgi:TatD DNase family protein
VDLGLYIGISGVVTFKNAGQLVDVIREVSMESLLIETDCPFLAPEPYRGQRNEPSYVRYVAEKVAEIKGLSIDEVEEVTYRNARMLFELE